jgi:hypothetical protein
MRSTLSAISQIKPESALRRRQLFRFALARPPLRFRNLLRRHPTRHHVAVSDAGKARGGKSALTLSCAAP